MIHRLGNGKEKEGEELEQNMEVDARESTDGRVWGRQKPENNTPYRWTSGNLAFFLLFILWQGIMEKKTEKEKSEKEKNRYSLRTAANAMKRINRDKD